MRKTFLMCEPTFYDVTYVINPWMSDNINKVNKQLARQQWKKLYDVVSSLANVELIDPVPGAPDMVFTANAGLPIANNNYVWLSRFANIERAREEKFFHAWLMYYGRDVITFPQFEIETLFEGAGDALVDSDGHYWLGHGQRTQKRAVDEIARLLGAGRTTALELSTPEFYHLDTCFCPLSKGHTLWYPKAFTTASYWSVAMSIGHRSSGVALEQPDTREDMLIDVGVEDARSFACNAICIDENVILPPCSQLIADALTSRGYNPIFVEMSEFIKAGGAAKCLTLQLS